MEFWKRKTIYRKILLIAMTLHLIGCFVLPFAVLHSSASYINEIMSRMRIGELPEKMTLISLIGFLNDRGSSDGMVFTAILVFNAIALLVHFMGKKRGSYILGFILWTLIAGIESFIPDVVYGIRKIAYNSSAWGNLLFILCAVSLIVSVLGILFEEKAKAKGAGSVQFRIDPEKIEKLKKNAKGAAETATAVAKSTAKKAAKELPKMGDAVKEFVENAKREEKEIPQTGSITGMKGMFHGAEIPVKSGETIVIGRDEGNCHIILEGNVVSRKHCAVSYDGMTGSYLVTDFSENGTYVGNGGKLSNNQKTALNPGTVICIGNDENIFRLG